MTGCSGQDVLTADSVRMRIPTSRPRIVLQLLGHERPRAHERHVAHQDVP